MSIYQAELAARRDRARNGGNTHFWRRVRWSKAWPFRRHRRRRRQWSPYPAKTKSSTHTTVDTMTCMFISEMADDSRRRRAMQWGVKWGEGGDGRGAAGPLPRANVRPRRLPGAAADRSSKSLLIDRPTNYRHRLGRRAARDCRLRRALGDRSVAQIPRSALPTPCSPPQGEVR